VAFFCATLPFGNRCFGLIPCAVLSILGNMLCFNVDSKEAFQVSLADVSQSQMQGKTDVVLDFHVDDTTGNNEKDSLMDLSFHVPASNTQFVGDEHHTSA